MYLSVSCWVSLKINQFLITGVEQKKNLWGFFVTLNCGACTVTWPVYQVCRRIARWGMRGQWEQHTLGMCLWQKRRVFTLEMVSQKVAETTSLFSLKQASALWHQHTRCLYFQTLSFPCSFQCRGPFMWFSATSCWCHQISWCHSRAAGI